jgi:uncharacterized protein (UPF0210 family)
MSAASPSAPPCKVRTVTACITPSSRGVSIERLGSLVATASKALRAAKETLAEAGYETQTVRVAFPPVHTWMPGFARRATREATLDALDAALETAGIDFCALGSLLPARLAGDVAAGDFSVKAATSDDNAGGGGGAVLTLDELPGVVAAVVRRSPRFNVAVDVQPGDVAVAHAAAQAVLEVSRTTVGGLGNFRLCASAHVMGALPFFPGAVAPEPVAGSDGRDTVGLALGLENGALLGVALAEAGSIVGVPGAVARHLGPVVEQLRARLETTAAELNTHCDGDVVFSYLGLDSSANPALDAAGSVAAAIEKLEQVACFGGSGTLAAAAAVTRALQALPGPLVGYCGLMLPVCEDLRLAELAAEGRLTVTQLLNVSSVCGVGVDTVPVPGDVAPERLAALYLDVAGLAHRWGKALSCRVFPVPGHTAGAMTTFDNPYLANTAILPLD